MRTRPVPDDLDDRAELMAARAQLARNARLIAEQYPDIEMTISSHVGIRGEFAEQLQVSFRRKAS